MRRLLWVCALVCLPIFGFAEKIELTRHIGTYGAGETPTAEAFFGVAGTATLTIQGSRHDLRIRLNGAEVGLAEGAGRDGASVELVADNRLEVVALDPVIVRVEQVADIALNVLSRVHFNTNVSDFKRSRTFYGKLGFETLSGFPDTNTLAMADAIGVETPTAYDGSQGGEAGGYLLHGELISAGGFGGGVIDLIEFTIPRDETSPYEMVNHLGMARAVLHTTDLSGDFAKLSEVGVQFVSAPVQRDDGSRFVLFHDPDGTFYELAEVEGERGETAATNIVELGALNINVSDFQRSVAWYKMLGYELHSELASTDNAEVAQAMGFDEPYRLKGAVLVHKVDGSIIELVQWLEPFNPEPPYAVPINHLGIHRTAFSTTDIAGDVAALQAQGVELVSPVTPCCSGPDSWGGIVAFYDPDGTIVELVEQPVMNAILKVTNWLGDLF
jgi:catechol 2,3-dioxygenase-like lactoylglutathione lyase family enzyme